MKICFMKSSEACDRYRPECRQIVANLDNCEVTIYPYEADVIIQFFCVETDDCIIEAADQLKYIKRFKKDGAKVIIAGCAANSLGDVFLQFDCVDYVISRKPLAKTVLEILGCNKFENIYYIDDDMPYEFPLEISHGCQKKCGPCNFCFNALSRIPVRSVPMEYLIEAAKNGAKSGANRVELLALNSTNYGIDLEGHKQRLHELIQNISAIPEVSIIDVYSLTVCNMYPELVKELIDNPKIGLVEMGIQAATDHLLSCMNTGSTVSEIESLLDTIVPHKKFKTIFIVGHPGETEEDFEAMLNMIRKYNLWHVQINPYIRVEGTKAGSMEQVPFEVIQDRFYRAKDLKAELRKKYFDSLVGKRVRGWAFRALEDEDGTVELRISHLETLTRFSYFTTTEKFDKEFASLKQFDIVSGVVKEIRDYSEDYHIIEICDIEVE